MPRKFGIRRTLVASDIDRAARQKRVPAPSAFIVRSKEPSPRFKADDRVGISELMPHEHKAADMRASPFENIKFVRPPDGRTDLVVGVWNFGEAFEFEFEHDREIWAADELLSLA